MKPLPMRVRTKKYTEVEIGDLKVIEDFLPAPEELVLREDATRAGRR